MRQIVEKLRIGHTRLLMSLNGMDDITADNKHSCSSCDYKLDEQGALTFDILEELETSIQPAVMQSLVYIAGYVTRKENESADDEESYVYFKKHGAYQEELDRGKLKKPTDKVVQWVAFCYAMFGTI